MATKRNRHERGKGTTSQAFRATKFSLLCYRARSGPEDGTAISMEPLSKWTKRLHLSRKNIRFMLKGRRGWLYIKKFRHRYYVAVVEGQEENVTQYILSERSNHPAKKGKGRACTGYEELNAVNRVLYPDGVNLLELPE